MPELMPFERLLPCLLDRLTDEEPGQDKESRDRRVVTLRRYVEGVRRDLDWLLNAVAHAPDEPIGQFEEAARSVLNYGIPSLCGMTASAVEPAEVAQRIQRAILAFEPRILRSGLAVRVLTDPDSMEGNAASFEIDGRLWARPAPEPFYVKTQVDLETGHWEL
ncbi:MAG TPA: type VI secretion system baseplate subunit TssE [Planctomycetota bacterium]|nr:type VI secretion system baseplate subunit TssE [Planctomycetota bacterium]